MSRGHEESHDKIQLAEVVVVRGAAGALSRLLHHFCFPSSILPAPSSDRRPGLNSSSSLTFSPSSIWPWPSAGRKRTGISGPQVTKADARHRVPLALLPASDPRHPRTLMQVRPRRGTRVSAAAIRPRPVTGIHRSIPRETPPGLGPPDPASRCREVGFP